MAVRALEYSEASERKIDRLFIEQHIDSLSKEDHIYIFKIVRPYINKNATSEQDTIVDLSRLPDNILMEVKNMVEVCIYNNKRKEDIGKYSNEHENNMARLEKNLVQRSKNQPFLGTIKQHPINWNAVLRAFLAFLKFHSFYLPTLDYSI